MRLHMMTWLEVERHLGRETGLIIPIGSTEQHGPIGLIGTDAICPEVIADLASEQQGHLVGPTISVGMAQHHLAFPGSVALRPTTLIAVICDYVNSLARNGFDRFYFLNGHGGNIATIGAAFSQIHAERSFARGTNQPPVRCKLANWFGFPEVRALAKELYADRDGRHATASEVAVTQYACPGLHQAGAHGPRPSRAASVPGRGGLPGAVSRRADRGRQLPCQTGARRTAGESQRGVRRRRLRNVPRAGMTVTRAPCPAVARRGGHGP